MPIRRWKHALTTGALLAGADGTAPGQPPAVDPVIPRSAPVAPPAPGCVPAPRGAPIGWKAPARGSVLHYPQWPETPLGSTLALHFQTHVTNGLAARMALYDYDFVRDTARLNVRGLDRVRQIAALVPHNQFPVVIERLPHAPALAEARRQAVLAELAGLVGFIPPERVFVGTPTPFPLRGPEAERIYLTLLSLTESAGKVPPTLTWSGASGFTPLGTAGGTQSGAGVGGTTGR